MYPSSPRPSVVSRIWHVVSRPIVGFWIAVFTMAGSTAALLTTTTPTVAIPQLVADSSGPSTPIATLEPTATMKDGLAQLTIALSAPNATPVTVRAVVDGVAQEVVVPAGKQRASLGVPISNLADRVAVMLTSYDVTTLNGVATLDR